MPTVGHMQPPHDFHDQFESDVHPRREHVGLMVMWADASISVGRDATDVLRGLCGGWNPNTLTGLRRVLAQRSGLEPPRRGETNRKFLERLAAAGTIVIFDADRHFPEFVLPDDDEAA